MNTTSHPVALDQFLASIASPLVRSGALDAPEPQSLAVRALRGEWQAMTGRELSEGQARRILVSVKQTLKNG